LISLRKRLGRGLSLVLCIIFVIHWIAADWVIRAVAEKQMANRLADDGYSLMQTLTSQDSDQVGFNGMHISSVYNRRLSGHYYLVNVDAQAYPSPSLAQFPLQVEPVGPGQYRIYHLNGPEQQPLLVLGLGLVKFGHRINISVAEDLSAVDHDITAIRVAYLGLTLLVLVLAIFLLNGDIKRSLRPVVLVGREIEQVSRGYQQRIELDVPTEINPMVSEINHLLTLVVRRLQQSRTAVGNLAHALKPPIAILFRIAEDPIFNQHPHLRQELQTQTDSIHRYIERELKRARIAGDQQAATVFNLRQELFSLKKTLRAMYADKTLDIQITAPNELVHFDREDLMELLGNLLDNACKWASQRIDVEIEFAKTLIIRVADDGPGCTSAEAQKLTQRGLRLDESVQGHGLGLSIISDIVNSYQGSLDIGRSKSLGGFLATVTLPLR
jgi:signal transduction histidine kinase